MFSTRLLDRLRLLRWAIPIALFMLVAIYQLAIAPWIGQEFGSQRHLLAELFFYGTGGPLLAFLVLNYVERWLEERQTSELQAHILEETRQHVTLSRELNDEALQSLYGISILLDSLEARLPDLPAETAAALGETERALDDVIQRIRGRLQGPVSEMSTRRNGKAETFPVKVKE
ncbi:MAG TPA: histidine kinase dimerization/phosphoacceptor domain-containing protein [Anaerolineales bacterium]|nr:histidine kinase dimerization/phosphoacceptor domain-containing protein [Anaerolineales bacterium]